MTPEGRYDMMTAPLLPIATAAPHVQARIRSKGLADAKPIRELASAIRAHAAFPESERDKVFTEMIREHVKPSCQPFYLKVESVADALDALANNESIGGLAYDNLDRLFRRWIARISAY